MTGPMITPAAVEALADNVRSLRLCEPSCCEGCTDCLGIGLGCHNQPASRLLAEARRLADLPVSRKAP